MSENTLGYLFIAFGIIGFFIKEFAVKKRMKLYIKIRKPTKQKDIENAEKLYRVGIMFGSFSLILLGIWLIFRS
jgi:hypothetical protein